MSRMVKQHHYETSVNWTGNRGEGTLHYKSYDRDHIIVVDNKAPIRASSDPAFMGNSFHYNPEELLLASLSSCHMLWYLHLCADAGIIVIAYTDMATATMEENNRGGKFIEARLQPQVTVATSAMIEQASALHKEANQKCFIANSCNFPVYHSASIKAAEQTPE